VELFFKWIKHHLRIKSFFSTTANAVKTQVWIADSVYIIVVIIKKQIKLNTSRYTILQVLSVIIFEKIFLLQKATKNGYKNKTNRPIKKLNLFN